MWKQRRIPALSPEVLDRIRQIPILVYHKIDRRAELGVNTIRPETFAQQMQFFQDHGYRSITFLDVLQNRPLPAKPFILTFDDAFESVYHHAYPILQSVGFRAVVCVVVNFVGKPNAWDVNLGGIQFSHLNWQQLRELQAAGWEVASHTLTHRALPFLNARVLEKELRDSRNRLEAALGGPVVSVAYPFGLVNARVLRAARDAGYRVGLGNTFWRATAENSMALTRIPIFPFEPMSKLLSRIENGNYGWYRMRWAMLRWPAVFSPIYQLLFRQHLFLDK
ncbi:MAG: polysaccharide deacetylase family protein [Calditrichaeota bacterium]|nr:polysaccharide deacetylase family protein [Calditrichota bacterium]